MTTALPVDDQRRMRRRVGEVASTVNCVGRVTVERIAAECGGAVTAEHVMEVFATQDVRVVDLPELPHGPPPEMPLGLLECVAELRLRLSVEVVFGSEIYGFRVLHGFALETGQVLDDASFAAAAPRIATIHEQRDRELRDAVLTQLRALAASPTGADAVILWEVVRPLRELAREEFTQMALTTQAVHLHLGRGDAEVLAAALVEERDGPAQASASSAVISHASHPTSAPAADRPVLTKPEQPAAPPSPDPAAQVSPPELAVRPSRPGEVTVTWTVPEGATIALRRAPRPPSWRRGAAITVEAMTGYGVSEPTGSAVPTRDGRMRRTVPVTDTVSHLTALAVTATRAVVGDTVVLADAAPVGDVRLRRFGPQTRLRWEWPADAVAAIVTWTPEGGGPSEARTVRCSRREFFDGGGLALDVGYGAGTLAVRAAYGYESAQVLAPPIEAALSAEGVPVRYQISRRPGTVPIATRHYQVLVSAEQDCVLPDLVVVESHRKAPPTGVRREEIVERVPSRRVVAGETVVIPVDPPGRGSSWLVCLVDDDSTVGDPIVLLPPPTRELRRR